MFELIFNEITVFEVNAYLYLTDQEVLEASYDLATNYAAYLGDETLKDEILDGATQALFIQDNTLLFKMLNNFKYEGTLVTVTDPITGYHKRGYIGVVGMGEPFIHGFLNKADIDVFIKYTKDTFC